MLPIFPLSTPSTRIGAMLALGIVCSLVGCSSAPLAPGRTPDPLSLTLWMRTTTQRFTYFELKPDGQLRYSGGREAMTREARPVLTLSPAQRQQVWDVIAKHHLMEAPTQFFPNAKNVLYEFSISAGGQSAGGSCVDDEAPGLKELHDLLFKFQGDVRYDHPAIRQ